VISPIKEEVPGTFLIGSKSTPIIVELTGMHYLATCIHPPGAAHKSTRVVELLRKLYFLFNCINLYAALDRYP
jgi:hypothetical protein